MTGIVKTFDRKSGKGFIIPSDGRKEVQVHISAFTPRDAEVLIPGLRVEFCRVNGLRGPTAANVGNDSNLLIVFYVQIMPDDFVMQLHRF